jgi:hypothetical protein
LTKQDQQVGEGAEAYQAARDVVVNRGISVQQMGEILTALAAHISIFRDEALNVANARIADFEKKVLEKFADVQNSNREAFKQPDFIAMLARAQEQFVRADDPDIGETLVDLISRRSLETQRGRLALTLNDAITRVGTLTSNELAEMSVAFLVRWTHNAHVFDIQSLAELLTSHHLNFVDDLSKEMSSYLHIQSQGCGSLETLTAPPLLNALKETYPIAFSAGFTSDQLRDVLPQDKASILDGLISPHRYIDGNFQFRVPRTVLDQLVPTLLPEGPTVETIVNQITGQRCGDELYVEQLEKRAPGFSKLKTIWDNSALKSLTLNSVGIAIAHANAKRIFGLPAPLEIWIK